MIDYIREFFEYIQHSSDLCCATNAMSELNHELQELSNEDLLSVFRIDKTKGYSVAKKHKVYIAALAEYVYNKQGVAPPDWVFDDEFYLKQPEFSDAVEFCCEKSNSDIFRRTAIKDAIPEFKKRNYMITEVLNAI